MTKSQKIAVLAGLGLALLALAYHLRAIFMPLLVGLLLAYIFNPLVNALEARKVPRAASILGLYVVLLAGLALFLLVGIPALVAEGADFVKDVTKPDAKARRLVVWAGEQLRQRTGIENWEQAWKALQERLTGQWGSVAKAAGDILSAVVAFATGSLSAFLATLGFVALVPVYLFFLLLNMNGWWDKLTHAFPKPYRPQMLATFDRIHRANASFFRGQVTIAAIEAAVVFIVLAAAGAKLSLFFGLVYFFLALVPFVGPFLWLVTALLFTLLDTGAFGGRFFAVVGLFLGIQALEGAVLQPLILGKETGLHPIAITLALLAFGQLFGFFGMLIAVPLAAAAKIVFEDYVWPMFADVAELTRIRPRS